jgi:hypothetical protein
MSDQEKAVEEAKKAGRSEALTETGGKLVKAEVRAALAGRMGDDQIAALVEGLNAANFLTEDGDVDPDKVKEVRRRHRTGRGNGNGTGGTSAPFPDLGQGARGGSSNEALTGDPILQSVKSKLGIT